MPHNNFTVDRRAKKLLECMKKWCHDAVHLREKVSRKNILLVLTAITILSLITLFVLEQSLLKNYRDLGSTLVKDRHGKIISTLPNSKGEYSNYESALPKHFIKLLVKKEDRLFYIHPGINPVSIVRSIIKYSAGDNPGGSSTITQQLAKNLLGNENVRSLPNKIIELFYTLGLEIFLTKENILTMYANTVYMGNNIQGFGQASIDYFAKELKDLNESEFVSLLATLSNPSSRNPWKSTNKKAAAILSTRLRIDFNPHFEINDTPDSYIHTSPTAFEFNSLGQKCEKTCVTTLDKYMTERLRKILQRNIYAAWDSGARNGAIVVIKLPENELLAIVGSPDPAHDANGHSINMAIKPRPIGSTAKPFIYLAAFEKGLRPYTLVEDREYKYPIATGYPLYPKNYDGLFHGTVTLHESLSNSYNVPTVKTLEYVGLSYFYNFLEQKLSFVPLQNLDAYQFGIALGGLEMDPLTLAYFFSIFPERGMLKPLRLYFDAEERNRTILSPMSRSLVEKRITDQKYTELVTKVLTDRKTGVEQFGLKSNLNLTQDNYAVKTGTSRDYHDSWTVGFTPDYIVAVWLGNAENEPLKHITGQSGAGQIWNESMELLANSKYNHKTQFVFSNIREFLIGESIDFGLQDDTVSAHKNLLQEDALILSPHHEDTILLEQSTAIPLKASREASWYSEDSYIGTGSIVYFHPIETGTYRIKAVSKNKTETILIKITD